MIMKKQKILDHLCSGLGVLLILTACQTKIQKSELSFQSRLIMDSVTYLWVHCPADVTNDNITDLVFIHNNASGGYLGSRSRPGKVR